MRAALRVLITARDMMTTERTSVINALTALVRTVELGIDARRSLTASQIAKWRDRNEDTLGPSPAPSPSAWPSAS